MKVIGVTSGIGSLEYGFKQQGFEILHHHEWRKYYNTGTYEKNYGNFTDEGYEVYPKHKGVDVIVSHPECGNFSNLYCGPNREQRQGDPGDIYKFIDLCKLYQPQFFLVDNLPKSLMAVNPWDWEGAFPDYDIHFELVSNWGYGNVQKFRNRLFIIGSHKDTGFKFVPGEREHQDLLIDAIEGIEEKSHGHYKMELSDITQWSGYQIGAPGTDRKVTLEELQKWLGGMPIGRNMPYYNKKGELKAKPGYSIVRYEHSAPVLSGGGGLYDNHWIWDQEALYYRPLTMRERLRIQGFGDEFELSEHEFEWGSPVHRNLIKQTGKCMPVQFPEYFARQVKGYLKNGTPQEGKGTKVINQIDVNKFR